MKISTKIKPRYLILALCYLLPITFSINSIIKGTVPFWHDPARDLLQAWNNQTDPTLIGPPTGIEGIFYGPYWIWWLSFWQLFSKSPRFVILMSQAVPYFLGLPALLFLFRKSLKTSVLISLCFLFLFAFVNYTNFLWNPHLSLLFLLALIWSATQTKLTPKHIFLSGLLVGFTGNFHMSIGLITAITTFIYYLVVSGKALSCKAISLKQVGILLLTFVTGIALTILPFIVFELRHDFLQTQTFIENIQAETNTLGGIKNSELFQKFTGQASRLLKTTYYQTIAILFVASLVIFADLMQKQLSLYNKQLLLFCTLFSLVLFGIYGSTSNPVWDYHFLGVEIIFVCWLALAASLNRFFRWGLIVWSIFIFFQALWSLPLAFKQNALGIPSVGSKQHIVEQILQDADRPFQWEAYSNDWRTTDFEYLFRWLALNNSNYDNLREKQVDLKYLIIPVTSQDLRDDFINYKSSDDEFTTESVWKMQDYTEVIKRVRK